MTASRRELLGTMAQICSSLLDLDPYNPANIKRLALAIPVRARALRMLRSACFDVVDGDRDAALEDLQFEVARLAKDLDRLYEEAP